MAIKAQDPEARITSCIDVILHWLSKASDGASLEFRYQAKTHAVEITLHPADGQPYQRQYMPLALLESMREGADYPVRLVIHDCISRLQK